MKKILMFSVNFAGQIFFIVKSLKWRDSHHVIASNFALFGKI